MLEHSVGGIRLRLEPDEVTVVRSGAVAAPEVVAGDDDDPSLGEELGLTEAGAPRRVQVPVAAVVGAARDRDDDERAGWQLLGDGATIVTLTCRGSSWLTAAVTSIVQLTPDHVARSFDRRARSSPFRTFPLALSGSSSTTSTRRGTL